MKTLLKVAVLFAALALPATAHAGFFFDQNMPDTRWKTFETEHFIFHYYESAGKSHPNSTAFTARRAAKYAEVMFPKVCEQFNHFLKEKVHVVVRDQEENANGFAVYTEDWVTIWATPLYYPLRGRVDWIPDVMTHEFAHIVSLKANEVRGVGVSFGASVGGLQEDGRNDIAYGGTLPFGEGNSAPFWWTEGGAEFWTHNVGYNHWGSSRDALLRMSMLDEDATLTLDQLAVRGDKTGLDGERGYNHGYSIGLYLAEKYGQETYSKFAEASKSKTRLQWENVIKEVLGITPDQMWAGWVQWNRDKYGKVKADLEKEGMHEGWELSWTEPMWVSKDEKKQKEWKDMGKRKRRWTREKAGIGRWHPRVSPTGDAFGYTDFRRGGLWLTFTTPDDLPAFTGVWLDPEKKEEEKQDEVPANPAIAKPGRTSGGFAADEGGAEPVSDKEKLDRIPTLNLTGSIPSDWSFSPDGNKIVFTAERRRECMGSFELDGYEWYDLAVLDLTKVRETAKLKLEGKHKKELHLSCGEIRGAMTALTHDQRAQAPAWSPNGEWIAYVKYGDGTTNIWKMKPDGSEAQALTKFEHGEAVGEPKWSPDSKKLVFYFFKPEQQDIFEMNADGTDFHPLTWDKFEDKDAIYSTDGKSVFFSSDRTGIFNIYRIDVADGESVAVLEEDKISVTQSIKFKKNKDVIDSVSNNVLDEVAAILKVNPEVKKIRIEGHASDEGDAAKNQDLSDRRAKAVREYLISKKIDGDRLEAQGFGESKPLSADVTDEARAKNRRVEFNIVESTRATKTVKTKTHAGKVTQITNSLGGAHQPAPTKNGNLLYIGFNAFGFQNYAIASKDFFDKPVEGYKVPSDAKTAEYVAELEELPPIPTARKYSSIKDLQPPVFFPIGRFEDQNIQGGGEVIWWDYAGKHALIADLLLGQNQDYIVRYINDMWYPTLGIIWARFDRSRELGFEYDPGLFGEIKLRSRVDFYLLTANWRVGPRHSLSLTSSYRSFDVRFGGDAASLQTALPWDFGTKGISSTATVNASLDYFTVDPNVPRGSYDINPRGSRAINTEYQFGFTRLADSGGDIDDGERLKEYPFHTIQATYGEFYSAPWMEYLEHTIQLTVQGGFIDRNVQFNDEMFAGGQHPYAAFNQVNVNTQFAGFEPFSVIGETMLISSIAYRMPLYRDWDKKVGPFYFDSVYLQFFGTAGNLWSFRPLPTAGTLVTGQTTGNRRELPFVGLFDSKASDKLEGDYANVPIEGIGGHYGSGNPGPFEKAFPIAYKNGNRILTDVGAEIRIRAYAYNYNSWFSFFRAAYGVQDTAGVGDQNGDRIFRDLPPADDPVGEIEKAGFRYYIGIGTGW